MKNVVIPPSWTFQDVANLIAQLRSEADRSKSAAVVAHRERAINGLIQAAVARWGKSPA